MSHLKCADMTHPTSQSLQPSALHNEGEVDASTCGLVSVLTCFTSYQSSSLDNEEARE
jgi:hypothetical protein